MELEAIKNHLQSQNINVSDELVKSVLLTVESKQSCLAGYDEGIRNLLILHFVTLMSLTQSRGIKSQTSKSGASRSFDDVDYNSIYKTLRALDNKNCLVSMLPDNEESHAGLWVASPSCQSCEG